ncbi:MAG: hypothetical protein NC933_03395, partial [Candidatus Omnitrophica bacterium]|nr:hypothetical protein [Candidatus Omnitrophota bacterium]
MKNCVWYILDVKNKKYDRALKLASILADIISSIGASATSLHLRFSSLIPKKNIETYLNMAILIIGLRILGFYVFRFYDGVKNKTNFDIFVNSVKACTASSIIIIAVLYFLDIEYYPRSVAILAWAITILYVNAWRLLARRIGASFFGSDIFKSRVLIIGTGKTAQETALRVTMDASLSYNLVGFIDTGSGLPIEVDKSKIIGRIDKLPLVVRKFTVDEVILADPQLSEKSISELVSLLSWENVSL